MERFAFKIDAALKANLYKICRLCGIDNPEKVQIENNDEIIDLEEPNMCQKIYELVGFKVSSTDKMPQTMCSLCVDKINDFYEFREMCYATNKQTRNLLGLPQIEPTKLVDFESIVKREPQVPAAAARRGRKRKTDDSWTKCNLLNAKQQVKRETLPWTKKLRMHQPPTDQLLPKTEPDVKNEPLDLEPLSVRLPPKKARKSPCSVCGEKFFSKEQAEKHKSRVHIPSIPRYVCNACNQTHHHQTDIRAHQIWHKLSKTPYKCPLCEASLANAHAFTRHLREHTPPTPVELLVLDRECPLCKKTFVTNFFYNTHRCAIRKRRCGGCSRVLNTEAAYMRHAPTCAKIYLHHSTHILPEEVNSESQIRIKNEIEDFDLSGLPPATEMPSDFVIDEDMQPVVVLERLSSPILRASEGINRLGRSTERVSAKKYLKRVDQLLKSTMSTLVSIKHEPEVHISDAGPTDQLEEDEEDDPPDFGDHFAAANDDSEEEPGPTTSSNATAAASCADADNVAGVSVKEEPVDEADASQVAVKQEPLKLKLKITKNHGKLNSSLIDDLDEAGQSSGRGSKKKKKRKHKEREKNAPPEARPSSMPAVTIKQEPMDKDTASADFLPEATVMTTIPMTQFESSYSEPPQEKTAGAEVPQEQEDIKPNRIELDRLMQISHVASGVDMAEEAVPLEKAVEATPDESQPQEETPANVSPPKESPPKAAKSTARKSTGGTARKPQVSHEASLPQIVAVESGGTVSFAMPLAVHIKPEPQNLGYADEPEPEPELVPEAGEEINHNEKLDEEGRYISNLDLNNVSVKQEKDLDISDESAKQHCNGLDRVAESEDEDNNSSADEAEEAMEEEEEQRVYREIELPPLEQASETEQPSSYGENNPPESQAAEPADSGLNIVITNIFSQAEDTNTPRSSQSAGDLKIADDSPTLRDNTFDTTPPEEELAASASDTQEANPSTDVCHALYCSPTGSHSQAASAAPLESPSEIPLLQEISPSLQDNHSYSSLPVEKQGDNDSDMQEVNPSNDVDKALRCLPMGSYSQAVSAASQESASEIPLLHSPSLQDNRSYSSLAPEKPEGTAYPDAESLATVSIDAPKDSEAQALPTGVEINYASDEEHQNVLNHELSEQQHLREGSPASPIETPADQPIGPNEETENRINEQQQEQMELQEPGAEDLRAQRCQANEDSNINEIAENNNNANIERELQDDALGAQENVNQ
ncbi:hypothetical protein KR018_011346 [Drosophila ironensis]|nr:hypothetical protein KR018_011346 [Drosophila ironensis]